MVNKGAGSTLLIKKWADAHGLEVNEKAAECISGTNGTLIKIVGMISMTLLLVPKLDLDMSNIAICSGNFYQGLGCDLLYQHNKALSITTITLPGMD